MACTVVGVFDNQSDATAAQKDLIQSGFNAGQINIRQSSDLRVSDDKDPGFWDSLKDAFGFGDQDDEYGYAEHARRGGVVLSATVNDTEADRAAEVIRRHNPVDIDERKAQWKQQGWSGYQGAATAGTTGYAQASATQATARTQATAGQTAAVGAQRIQQGEESIPVVQEELKVGKRAVQGGGVRVYTRISETPVQEQVNLREEHVHVERTPVNRPVAATDAAFQERVIEATEMAEEAVVSKSARVVEEVKISKDVGQRTETVSETLRRTDVEVERLETDPQYAPAREFATTFFSDNRYKGRSWDEIESDARTSFEQRNPGQWDRFRDVIRSRYDREHGKTRAST